MESKGAYVSDECYKMALTDALSVAMKALGVAADVYFEKGKYLIDHDSKYDLVDSQATAQSAQPQYHPDNLAEALEMVKRCVNRDNIKWVMGTYMPLNSNPQFMQALSAKRKELGL